ncbi:MAG: ABC transporter ATP-binding protein [Phycisphaerales bacterium]|nr:ABC transporter ATP-binding protein [Phycisphaerales bacterium]
MNRNSDHPAGSLAARLRTRLQAWRKTLFHHGWDVQAAEITATDGEQQYRPINFQLIRRLLTCLKPYRWKYASGITLGLLMVLLEMQSPRFIAAIINYTTNYVAGQLQPMPTEAAAIRHLVAIIGLWALVLAVALVLQRTTILIMTDAGERVQFDLRRRLFDHLQSLSMSFYDRTRLGRIISRCTSDISGMREVNVWGIDIVAKCTLMMIVSSAMLLKTEPRLFLAVAWLGPVLFVLNRIYRTRAAVLYQRAREGFTRVSTNLAENITGVRIVAACCRQEWNLGVFNVLQDQNTVNNVRAARANGVYQPLLNIVGFVGRAIILLYGGYLIVAGRLDRTVGIGSVVAAFLYWDWFMSPVLNFGNFYNQLMSAMAGGERVFTLLDTPPEISDRTDANPLPAIRGEVRFENVTFGYDPLKPVLHDISFTAEPGTMIALVGSTGSGKTSIVSLLARFYLPRQGRILVDGHDTRYVTGESLQRQMGLVLQTNYLFTGSVLDNIRYVRPEATEEQVIAAARTLGTYDALMDLADGLQTQVGERGANVSLGQRQLICFTRAFLADPRIFMLDEATSSVDTATEQLIQRSLERLRQGRTTFVVAHRLSTIQQADCILVLDHGRLVECGTHFDLLEHDGRYAELYEQFVLDTPANSDW